MTLTVTEAEALVLRYAGDTGVEVLPLEQAVGRVLRQDIVTDRAHPPYDRVMMDGIAFRAGASFPLTGVGMQPAGRPPATLPEGGNVCLEVMTGAVLPIGADCVLPIENVRRDGKRFFLREGAPQPSKGQYIHPEGADAPKGQRVLAAGQRLAGPALAALAANGYASVAVSQRPGVAVVATGDELVDVAAPVEAWQVRRSNDYALMGMFQRHGIESVARSSVPDDLAAMIAHLEGVLASHDIVVLSGGVSMGAFDYVPRALGKLGVDRVFHGVLQRPGGPLWFGIGPEGQRVFGLPGNPVSAMVCMARYVLPQLEASLGHVHPGRTVRLSNAVTRLEGRTRFVPVYLNASGEAEPRPVPTSGDFMALADTDGIVELPPGSIQADKGESVAFYDWS